MISETDLILNPDGSAYHLHLLPGDVADTIITVGDPGRVETVSNNFDTIEVKKSYREFVTHTGYIGSKRLTVISTGIGTGNIDIVLNELDALVNINTQTRQVNPEIKKLNIIRIGTSGALQADIPVDSLIVSSAAFGLDSLMHYYQQELPAFEKELLQEFKQKMPFASATNPYIAPASATLLNKIKNEVRTGITLTAPGFYAPQGRVLRAPSVFEKLLDTVAMTTICGKQISNLEMETAGIYGLANSLGHNAISFNIILANRVIKQFSKDPSKVIKETIADILENIILKYDF